MVQDAPPYRRVDAIGGMTLLTSKMWCFHDAPQHHAKGSDGRWWRRGSLVGDEEHDKMDAYPMDLGSGYGGWWRRSRKARRGGGTGEHQGSLVGDEEDDKTNAYRWI